METNKKYKLLFYSNTTIIDVLAIAFQVCVIAYAIGYANGKLSKN